MNPLYDLADKPPGGLVQVPVSAVYRLILDHAELPLILQTKIDNSRMKRAKRVLESCLSRLAQEFCQSCAPKASKRFRRYLEISEELAELAEKIATAKPDSDLAEANARMALLEAKLLVEGAKPEVERALEQLRTSSTSSLAAWFKGLRDRFDSGGGDQAYVEFLPKSASWLADEGWTLIGAHPTDDPESRLEFQLKEVKVTRPWFDEGLMESTSWWWSNSAPFEKGRRVSRGAEESFDGTSLLPCLPTSLLLGRSIRLDTPAVSFRSEDPVLLGWICQALPASPTPAPGLLWPSNWQLRYFREDG